MENELTQADKLLIHTTINQLLNIVLAKRKKHKPQTLLREVSDVERIFYAIQGEFRQTIQKYDKALEEERKQLKLVKEKKSA